MLARGMGVRAFVLGLSCAASACAPSPAAHALELYDFRQNELDNVGLNEELVFYFSEDLERGSVTSESVQVLGPGGRAVSGERIVRGNALTFVPDLPLASDLSDGALRPEEAYRVVLGGFPRPDGLRSKSGALLSASLRLAFRTARLGGPSPLFLDPFTGPFPLVPRGRPRADGIDLEDDRLVLECGEALDPASVPSARFQLLHVPPGASEPQVIALGARLLVNRRDHAELVLEPAESEPAHRRLAPDKYILEMVGRDLRTLGGRAIEPGWPPTGLRIGVPSARLELALAEPRSRSGEAAPGCAGTAHWGDLEAAPPERRGLFVRFPSVAGDGRAGEVELRAAPRENDLHATRLVVPLETRVDLGALVGPVVLRAQGTLEVHGRLVRAGRGAPQDPTAAELTRAGERGEEHWESASAWLARLLDPIHPDRAAEPWTVLVAGGDLRVSSGGAIEVDGPLVLIAGGWIRVGGKVYTEGNLWRTPEGGGVVAAHGKLARLPLALDPPELNPLRAPLVVGLLTQPFAWTPRAHGWRALLVGHEGGGHLSVSFLQSRGGRRVLLADPSALAPGPTQALLELTLPAGAGERWDPPRLEGVRLEALPGPEPVAPRR